MQDMRQIHQLRIDGVDLVVVMVPHEERDRAHRAGHILPVMKILGFHMLAGMKIDQGDFPVGPLGQNSRPDWDRSRHGGDQPQTCR